MSDDKEKELFLATVHNLTTTSGMVVSHQNGQGLAGVGITVEQMVTLIRAAAVMVAICQGRLSDLDSKPALMGAVGMLAQASLIHLPMTAEWVSDGGVDEPVEGLVNASKDNTELAKQIYSVEGLA